MQLSFWGKTSCANVNQTNQTNFLHFYHFFGYKVLLNHSCWILKLLSFVEDTCLYSLKYSTVTLQKSHVLPHFWDFFMYVIWHASKFYNNIQLLPCGKMWNFYPLHLNWKIMYYLNNLTKKRQGYVDSSSIIRAGV